MKFDSERDEILSTMANDGWANDSSGTVEAPQGWFARITNHPADMQEIAQAFDVREGFDLSELAGCFLLREDDRGFVYVTEYATEAELVRDYETLEAAYGEWAD